MASLSGVAVSADPARAQAAVNDLLRAMQASPYLGAPVTPPAMRMISGVTAVPDGLETNAPPRGSSAIPAGMSGIEFSVMFEIRK